MLNKSPIADIVTQAQAHHVRGRVIGNKISVVTKVKVAADRDLGIGGSITETVTQLCPEPTVDAISGQAVQLSGGAFWWTDLRLSVSRDALTEAQALDSKTEFEINGDRYGIIAARPGPSVWGFVIRRKTSEPTTP